MKGMLETMDQWLLNFLEEIHTTLPGKVEVYYGHKECRAKVVPLVRQYLQNGELVEIKAIDDVPVIFPSTAMGRLRLPLGPDDGVLLHFTEAGIGNYLHGKAVAAADADDPSRFSLSDCVAIPGLFPFATTPATKLAETAAGLEHTKGAMLALEQKVKLANGASDLRKELETLWDALEATQKLLKTWAPASASPGSPTVPNPAQVALVETEIAKVATAKTNLKQFLE